MHKVDGLLADQMRERFTGTSAPSAGATCAANTGVTLSSSKARNVLESIIFSARNVSGGVVTLTCSVRAISIAGTAIASWDILVANNTSVQDCYNIRLPAPRGQDLWVEFGTPVSSVTQKVSIAGYTEVNQVD